MIDNSKKLALKTELLRHMDTVKGMKAKGDTSSNIKMGILEDDIRTLDDHNIEPPMDFWKNWLNN